MSSHPPAGWYPDTSAQNLQRYWNGTQWTEYTAPLSGTGQGAPETPGQDPAWGQPGGYGQASAPGQSASYGQASAPAQPDSYGQASAPGAPGGYGHASTPENSYGTQLGFGQGAAGAASYGQAQQSYGQQPYSGQPGYDPTAYGPPPTGGQGNKMGLLIGIIVGAVVLIGALVVVGVVVFGDDSEDDPVPPPTVEPTEDPTDEPTDEPTDQPTDDPNGTPVEGGEFELGDVVSGSIDMGGEWQATVNVTEETAVIFDPRRDSDGSALDMTLTILDDSGQEIYSNDDRPFDLSGSGETSLNPHAALALEPGEYTVVLGTFADASDGDFTMATEAPELIAPGDEVELDLDDGEQANYALDIADEGDYTINATMDSGSAVVYLFDEAGDYQSEIAMDNQTELNSSLEPGVYPLVITEEYETDDTITVTIEED